MPREGSDVQSIEKTRQDLREPGMFHVILLNDNYTPMDFVVSVLVEIFKKSESDAMKIMMKVHNQGEGIAGTFIEDVAKTKSEITMQIAKKNGFPLTTKVQPA